MSYKENVELAQLSQKQQTICDHDGGGLDECEKEVKEEEMSLLGNENSQACPRVQIVTADRHSSGPVLTKSNPSHQQPITLAPGIQLARTEPECSWLERGGAGGRLSSIHSVCGPRPAKLTTICLLVLSIWVMVVLIIHLNMKVSLVTRSLSYTKDKLRSMEDTANSYRQVTQHRIKTIQRLLGEMSMADSIAIVPGKSVQANSILSTPLDDTKQETPVYDTKQETPVEDTKHESEEEEEDDFFNWSF